MRTWEPLRRYLDGLDTISFRAYQDEIGSIAATRNTLVILPTALGKTVIALKAAMSRLHRYPWGKVVFLAPTRPLVEQHARSFSRFLQYGDGLPGATHFSSCELNGKVPRSRRGPLFAASNLIFATPQTLANDIASGLYGLHDCVLVVLDECHRTAQRYAYNAIAATYMQHCTDPAILGLTASPGRTREQVLDLCERLHIEHVATRTMDDEDVADYIHPIDVDVVRCRLPLVYDEIDNGLRSLLVDRVARLQACGFLKEKPASMVNKMDVIQLGKVLWSVVSRELGADLLDGSVDGGGSGASPQSSARTGYFFWLVRLQSQCMKLLHLLELVSTQSMHAGLEFLRRMHERDAKSKRKSGADSLLLKEHAVRRVEIQARKAVERGDMHPKTAAVLELLDDLIPGTSAGEPESVIIFAQYRDTVNHLVSFIERLNGADKTPGRRFRPARFVGQASRTRDDTGQSQKDQQAVLDAFRAGAHNVLVATRIAEEGLDIPSVGHIIFYEPVPSEIRYIQRRGRTGRHGKGFVTILVADGTLDEIFLNVAFSRARAMNEIAGNLSGKPLQRVHRVPLRPPLDPPPACAGGAPGSPGIPARFGAPRPAQNATSDRHPGVTGTWNARGDDAPFIEAMSRFDELVTKFEYACDIDTRITTLGPARGDKTGPVTNWHEALKRCTSPSKASAPGDALQRPTYRGRTRMKRTGLKKFGEHGIPKREKLMTWIHDQVRELGQPGAEPGMVELDHEELAEMATFEEIEPEDFTYNLQRGAKIGYWIVGTNEEGKKKVSLQSEVR